MTRPVVGPRTTGATDDQIEAAIDRRFLRFNSYPVQPGEAPLIKTPASDEVIARRRVGHQEWFDKTAEQFVDYAIDLVPPDHRIVAVDDLVRLRSLWRTRAFPDTTEEVDVWLDGIDALIAGDKS